MALGENYEEREAAAVEAAKGVFGNRFSGRKVVRGFFADLYECDAVHPNHFSFDTNDSVGSKLMLAHASMQYPVLSDELLRKRGRTTTAQVPGVFDTVAIDGVAMNANDAAPWGAAWFNTLMKFTACQAEAEEALISGEIEVGLLRAMEMMDVSEILGVPQVQIGKCETASLEETITTVNKTHGFELVFCGAGFISKDCVFLDWDGEKGSKLKLNPEQGDVIIGFESSGFHSNGYTAARLRLLNGSFEKRAKYLGEYTGRFNLTDKVPGDGRTFLEVLLEPTIIYSKVMARVCKEMPYVYGVNITGNGLQNFNRAGKNVRYVINEPFEPHPVFRVFEEEVERQFRDGLIPEDEKYDTEKIYRKLNMGMGFACIAKEKDKDRILAIAKEEGIKAKVVGMVASLPSPKPETMLVLPGKKTVHYRGYG